MSKFKYGKELQTGPLFMSHDGVDIYQVTKCGIPQMYWYALGDIRKVGDFDIRSLPSWSESNAKVEWTPDAVRELIALAIDRCEIIREA